MFVDFDEMPGDSRIWIYQSDRKLSMEEIQFIQKETDKFLTQWSAHGAGLKSSAKVAYDRFLIICVDEKQAMASGCSIDASVHFVQSLSKALNNDFFNRTKVAFLQNETVSTESLENIKKNLTENSIDERTLTFNNLIQTKDGLSEKWIIPVSESWLNRYFKDLKV